MLAQTDVALVGSGTLLTLGLVVLIFSIIAFVLKSMLIALAIDDWVDLRGSGLELETATALDEVHAAVGRWCAVVLSLIVGTVWVVVALQDGRGAFIAITPVSITVAVVTILQAAIAVYQGARGLFFRRRLGRMVARLKNQLR
jgi:hypothetical protein